MKNKILFMYHASNIGGGTYCLLNILKEIDRIKYEPIVLLRTSGALVREINNLGIEVLFMPSMTLVPYNRPLYKRGIVKSYWRIEKSLRDFENMLKKVNPDAVYLNTMMLAPYLKVAKESGCRTVIHLREHWPLDEHVFQLSRVQKTIEKFADEIIAITQYSASMVPSRSATIVHDWIDMSNRSAYRPLDKILDEDTTILICYLFTGGLQDIKGALEIVDVFSNRIKDENKRLLMVGVDPCPNYNGLKNKIRFFLSKLGYNVYEYRLRKLISQDKRIVTIPATYALKHIVEQAYCNLSFFTIPHANLALAESIIIGTIPVAARTPESVEYSNNGECALLFELGNKDDMYEKLKYLDTNYDLLKSTIYEKRQHVVDLFDKKKNVATLHGALEKLFNH